jgi:type II secretory ATPase GspE/PulE/Tfp pilus assembly ATPase PilB-like protein
MNNVSTNIVTLEDPVEYRIDRIRQTQIDVKAGFTFAVGMRSIIRQDPDVIMIGEIRDLETAEIAIRSALTGHLVFSTLHTNDSASAITRLLDMGIEPFLVSSAVRAVLAQRLVRKLCIHCREKYEPSKADIKILGIEGKENQVFYRKKGCKRCNEAGYKGRIGIFELLVIDEEIREMILNKSPSTTIMEKSLSKGLVRLKTAAVRMVVDGITSVDEIVRVVSGGE